MRESTSQLLSYVLIPENDVDSYAVFDNFVRRSDVTATCSSGRPENGTGCAWLKHGSADKDSRRVMCLAHELSVHTAFSHHSIKCEHLRPTVLVFTSQHLPYTPNSTPMSENTMLMGIPDRLSRVEQGPAHGLLSPGIVRFIIDATHSPLFGRSFTLRG